MALPSDISFLDDDFFLPITVLKFYSHLIQSSPAKTYLQVLIIFK